MEISLKHRLVGALVLIALAIIFLPMIFDGKEKQGRIVSKIPAKPIPYTEAMDLPEKGKLIQSFELPVVEVNVPVESEPDPKEREKVIDLSSSSAPTAFILRLGSFKANDNAVAVLKKLKTWPLARHRYVKERIYDNGNRLFQVYVGPNLNLDELKAWQADAEGLLGLTTVIEEYEPTKHTP